MEIEYLLPCLQQNATVPYGVPAESHSNPHTVLYDPENKSI
jgi:hypothetical protein